ncbi:uncharacterized protein LMH87_008871 [Akanthomyces muscarius]|uniref:NADH-ubiquinone oxidoreductase B14 subunit n=1 Tax=Akanthomyces muscarius TaxID=2231603 RepID=A0A9W8QKJ6_AKAMU|nr:uncharacterized protein LMH87_008871 [Akanthomyces muscarius]KAJ4158340.1 hypothetical protein LMH87_008871 [Akanthomyces muscarius]
MAITPTQFAKKTAQSANWTEAKRRVLSSYREWLRGAPEVQTMYNMPMPISVIRNRMRQEFERNRFVSKLSAVDVLLFKSHAEYQEMMNFWKQTTHLHVWILAGPQLKEHTRANASPAVADQSIHETQKNKKHKL